MCNQGTIYSYTYMYVCAHAYIYNICWIQHIILIMFLLLNTNQTFLPIMSDFSSFSIIFKCYLCNVYYVPYSMCFTLLFIINWVNIFHMNSGDKTLYTHFTHVLYYYVCNIKTNMLLIDFKCWALYYYKILIPHRL